MSGVRDLKVLRFASAAHWALGIGARTGVNPDGMAPLRPLAPSQRSIDIPGGATAATLAPDGVLYWCSSDGHVAWLAPGASAPCRIQAPDIARSPRLVMGRSWLWTFSPGSAELTRFDALTLRQIDARLPGGRGAIVDIAADGREGVWVLSQGRDHGQCLWHVDGAGKSAVPRHPPLSACGLGRLGQKLVLLAADGKSLAFVDSSKLDVSIKTIQLPAGPADMIATRIDGDGSSRLFLTGQQGFAALWLDAEGGLVQTIKVDAQMGPLTGVAVRGDNVWVAGASGLVELAAAFAADGPAADGVYLSPRLHSPDTGNLRGWLRAELSAELPPGSMLTVTVMSTGDGIVANEAKRIAENAHLSPGQRQHSIEKLFDQSQRLMYEFHPVPGRLEVAAQQVCVPLFSHQGPWLWLRISLRASPDGELPRLKELQVLYPNISLMQYLPAIFQGDVSARTPLARDSGAMLRRMVGVLETTTQGLDRNIAALAGNLQAATASGTWLNYMARWFDLPWHDALPVATRRSLLENGEELLAKRGTRDGLRRLVELLAHGAAVRIVDHNADLGMLVLGGHQGRVGSALPAILGGLPPSAAALSRRTVLGQARLNRPGTAPSPAARFVDLVRVEVRAQPEVRSALADLMPDLIDAMLPAGMRAIIQWRPVRTPAPADGIILDDPSVRRLGKDSQLGMTRLARTGYTRLADGGVSTDIYLD